MLSNNIDISLRKCATFRPTDFYFPAEQSQDETNQSYDNSTPEIATDPDLAEFWALLALAAEFAAVEGLFASINYGPKESYEERIQGAKKGRYAADSGSLLERGHSDRHKSSYTRIARSVQNFGARREPGQDSSILHSVRNWSINSKSKFADTDSGGAERFRRLKGYSAHLAQVGGAA